MRNNNSNNEQAAINRDMQAAMMRTNDIYAAIGRKYYSENADNPASAEYAQMFNDLKATLNQIDNMQTRLKFLNGIVVCTNCKAENSVNSSFCAVCGTRLPHTFAQDGALRCPRCGNTVKPGQKFCGVCGNLIEQGTAQQEQPQGQQSQTFVPNGFAPQEEQFGQSRFAPQEEQFGQSRFAPQEEQSGQSRFAPQEEQPGQSEPAFSEQESSQNDVSPMEGDLKFNDPEGEMFQANPVQADVFPQQPEDAPLPAPDDVADSAVEQQAEEAPAVCPQCGALIKAPDALFCAECGFRLK